jgi:L-ribulose-5-phosphate 3-epimerase
LDDDERMSTTRRDFLKTATVTSAAAALGSAATALPAAAQMQARAAVPGGSPKKAILIGMLPRALSYEERFAMAKAIGFEAVEMRTVSDEAEAEAIAAASQKTGFRIHSVMNSGHWENPLSSPDPAVVDKCVAGMETSIRNAKLWGADTVLLVPAVVDETTGYRDAWTRSVAAIRERILPYAEQHKVIVGIEEVWNKFLLSPLEMVQYVDDFKSPWVSAYFDVGNVVLYGYPQDWIRTLGTRFNKVHLKDFKLDRREGRFTWEHLGEGDINWPEVRKAMHEVGYDGFVTPEIRGGDQAYLTDVAARIDRFLAGQPPVARATAP